MTDVTITTRPPHALAVGGKSYHLPEGVVRAAVEKLIDAADCGPSGFADVRQDLTTEARAKTACALMIATLTCDTDEEIADIVALEVERLGGGQLGAREAYANLLALNSWLTYFWSDFSERFLCAEHRDLAQAQAELAERYHSEHIERFEPALNWQAAQSLFGGLARGMD